MERPRPTKQFILETTGYNHGLIESFHHGLYETPLHKIYPFLDFDELVVFAASSWKSREKNYNHFSDFVKKNNIYQIFLYVNDIGFKWLYKHRAVSDNLKDLYFKLNPFGRKKLEERLSEINPEDINIIKENLLHEINEYLFECRYEQRKRIKGTNQGLIVMSFQNYYPKKGKIVDDFAAEAGRILSNYPRNYTSILEAQQLNLF